MKATLSFAIAALAALSWMPSHAQLLDTRTAPLSSSIKSIKAAPAHNEYAPPVIVLDSGEQIAVSFDELSYDRQYLRYSLVHCNADWLPSDLNDSEYVDGFNYADITDAEFSSGTFSHFVHYQFAVPNDDMRITKSGNYLIKVYPDDDPDDVLLQVRFSATENTVGVGAAVSSRTDVDYNNEHQQLSVRLNYNDFSVRDPYTDFKVVVSQNSRTDNEVTITKPMMVNGNSVVYEHDKNLIFPAGNEYRRMETVDINTLNMGVERIEYHDPYYVATLLTDEPRRFTQYLYDQTQFGRFTVRNRNCTDSEVSADYVLTVFTLNTEGPLHGGKIHIDGEFTNHLLNQDSEMAYDASTGCYTAALLLKQGAYNYQYLFVPDGSSSGITSTIEGDKYQTINEYTVKAYYRAPGDRYDRLVGFGTTFSGR